MSKIIQHKSMLSEVAAIFQLVFGSNGGSVHTINQKKNHHHSMVEIEFDHHNNIASEENRQHIHVAFDSLKGGKTDKRYKFTISYPQEKIGHFKISISKHCEERRQLIVVIEDFSLDKSLHLFIGKVESSVYMMLLNDQSWNGLSLAKVSDKLFNPTSFLSNSRCLLDHQSGGGVMVHNPLVFLVDDPNLTTRSSLCDSAMGMFNANDKNNRFEPVYRKTSIGNVVGVKAFSFTDNSVYPQEGNIEEYDGAYGDPPHGCCFKKGVYRYKKRNGKYQYLEFEECVELSWGHVRNNEQVAAGVFLPHVYVRGKMKKGNNCDNFTSNCCNLSGWKRLCILRRSNWITKYTLS